MIYLDQNKWIDLGLGYYQRPGGARFAKTLQKVRNAVQMNTAKFPFSCVHVLETMKMGDLSRRQRLARIMAEVSEGWTIAPQEKITPIELTMAIPKIFNKPFVITSPLVFGRGIEFAFGEPVHTQTILDALNSPVESKRRLAIHFFAIILSSPDESLRKPGIDRYNTTMNTIADNAEQIRNLVRNRNKDTQYRAFTARQVIEHLRDRPGELMTLLASIGVTKEDFFNLGRDGLTQLYADMPTMDVMMNLRNQRNMQYEKVIEPNDLNDFSFLSVAIPYCDIVVTERQWVDLAKRKKLDQKYKTILLSDVMELVNYI